MRIVCALVFVISILTAAPLTAREARTAQAASAAEASHPRGDSGAGALSRPARLDVEQVPLGSALAELARRSGILLAYSPSLLESDRLVTCHCLDATVEEAIQTLLPEERLDMVVLGDHLVIRKTPSPIVGLRAYDPDRMPALMPPKMLERRSGIAPPPKRLIQQLVGTVTGVVTSEGLPLSGAQVDVPQRNMGALTRANGRYLITGVPAGTVTVRVQLIGYATRQATVSVVAGQTVVLDFDVSIEAINLDAVVVTGTAGSQIRRAQGAVVTTVNVADIMETAPITNVNELLQARSAGVMIQGADGRGGTAARIRIRGNSSISLSNAPLVFVDGVRVDSRSQVNRPNTMRIQPGSFSSGDLGGQGRDRLGDINPEDIERIEIVKGPAAATLYGAEANTGVIQIFTKRGRSGRFVQTLNAEFGYATPNFTPLENWAICEQEDIDAGVPLCNGKQPGSLISDSPLIREGFLRDGRIRSFNWSGSGGLDIVRYFLSAGTDDEIGVLKGNRYQRSFARANFDADISPKLSFHAQFGLAWTREEITAGNHSFQMIASAYQGDPRTMGIGYQDGWGRRPGRVTLESERWSKNLRTTASAAAEYSPTDWLENRVTVGADFTTSDIFSYYPKNNQNWWSTAYNNGGLQLTDQEHTIYTFDYLGNARVRILPRDKWQTNLSWGSQVILTPQKLMYSTGLGYTSNTTKVISAAAQKSSDSWEQEDRSVGFFGQLEVGYSDRLFVQVGARADQHSAFGDEAPLFVLPKVGVSYVLSDEPFFSDWSPSWLNTVRLRGAYGTTGRAPPAGAALKTFTSVPYIDQVTRETVSGVAIGNPGNPNLKAERGNELEVGADIVLFNERLGVEVTYFNKVTKDLLLVRPIPISLGAAEGMWDNLGKVVNRGWEVFVNATLLQRESLSWNANLNLSTLHNELVDLGGLNAFAGRWDLWFKEGYPLGGAWSRTVKQIDVANNRAIVTDTLEYLGHTLPSFSGSFATTLSLFRNLRVSGQFEWRAGHTILNAQESVQYAFSRRRQYVDPNYLSKEDFLRRYGPFETSSGERVPQGDRCEDFFWEPGDFLRFRELTVSYTLPFAWAEQMNAERVTLTLAARNLGLWTRYSGFDPEAIANNAGIGDQFSSYDFFNLPTPRRWVAGLRVQF
jgi:TonB-linked SusC/RagA family outer membrane protein